MIYTFLILNLTKAIIADHDYFLVGTRFIADVVIAPVKNEDQEVIMFLITLRDITALKEHNERKSRRFSSLSTTNSYHHSHSSNNIHNAVDHNLGKTFARL